jgi:hypothetical protein
MAKRKFNHRLVKTHLSYSVQEAADIFQVHKNTVRSWQREGLTPIDGHKPTIFHGKTLAAFLSDRRTAGRIRLRNGEIYCVGCHAAKEPALDMADYVAITATSGNLKGICPTCENFIYRRVSLARLHDVAGNLDVRIAEAVPSLVDCSTPSVNCDNDEGAPR